MDVKALTTTLVSCKARYGKKTQLCEQKGIIHISTKELRRWINSLYNKTHLSNFKPRHRQSDIPPHTTTTTVTVSSYGQHHLITPLKISFSSPCVLAFFYLFHYPTPAGHPKGGRMYNTMRQISYCPHMVNHVYTLLHECRSRANNIPQVTYKRKLQLFPAGRLLNIDVIDISGPISSTKNGIHHVVIITNRFSKFDIGDS